MASRSHCIFAALALSAVAAAARAAVTWNGGANPNANWSMGNNWVGGVAPAAGAAQSLIFDGAVNLTPTNDIANPYQLNNITFAATAGAFNVSGQGIQFAGNNPSVTQSAAVAETISANIALNAGLTLGGNGAGVASITGTIAGAFPVTVSGGATYTLGGGVANSYSGVTTLVTGNLNLSKNANIVAVAGDIVIGAAASAGVPTLTTNADGQIASTSNVTLVTGALFSSAWDLKATNQTIATLKGNGAVSVTANGSLTTGGAGNASPFDGTISGTGALNKTGANVLTFSANSPNFAGTVNINQGTFKLNGNFGTAATRKVGAITSAANTLMTGKGNYFQAKGVKNAIKGKVQPGDDPGILTIGGDVEMQAGSNLTSEIDGIVPGNGAGFCSQLVVGGDLVLDVGSSLTFLFDHSPIPGASYVLIDNQSGDPIVGNFDGLPEGQAFTAGGLLFHITYHGNDPFDPISSNSLNNVVITAVPEPASLSLLAAGGLLLLRRRRRA